MAQKKRIGGQPEDFEEELEWLVRETAKLDVDLRELVLSIPRMIIAMARRQNLRERPDGTPKKRPPLM